MTRWRTVHNRRRRPPRRKPWRWYYGESWPVILPEQIPDLIAYGRCWTRLNADGTAERIDPLDVYPNLLDSESQVSHQP